uniref:Mitogen-activated protein kinase homolog NTF4-like n=1 Tax=Tanacetum cinerariifolium TaxID=118510 RepID=A0A6L2KWS2_TANCI|nr:mitogen-activated protein kinase homolog NTF4-like [Tanacetum cinerariifolium]
MDPSNQPTGDTEMSDAPPSQPPPLATGDTIPATLSHGGRFIQYNIFGNIFQVTTKYKPPIMPIVLASQQLTANSVDPGLLSKNSCVTVLSLDGRGVRGIVSDTRHSCQAIITHYVNV